MLMFFSPLVAKPIGKMTDKKPGTGLSVKLVLLLILVEL